MKQNKIPFDISILLFAIVAFILWLCKETVNAYLATVLDLAIISLILFVAYRVAIGLHRLAMLRLDYLHRKAEVSQAALQITVLNERQTLVGFNALDGSQILVTAPTPAQLPTPSAVAALPSPVETEEQKIIDLLPVLDNALSFAMACEKGAGKTSMLKRKTDMEVGKGSKVIVLDTQAGLNTWPVECEVITNRRRIINKINQLVLLYQERTEEINRNLDGACNFQPVRLFIDEMTDLTSLMDNQQLSDFSQAIKTLLNGRKQNIGVGIAGHSINAGNIGLKGNADLIKNFDLLIDISVSETGERTFRANTKPSTANKWSVSSWSLCHNVPAYNTNYQVKEIEHFIDDYEDEVEDYPPTFQPTAPTMSLNREMSAHQKKVMALLAAYPDGELPETKAEIHRLLGVNQAGNNIKLVDNAIEEYKKLTN